MGQCGQQTRGVTRDAKAPGPHAPKELAKGSADTKAQRFQEAARGNVDATTLRNYHVLPRPHAPKSPRRKRVETTSLRSYICCESPTQELRLLSQNTCEGQRGFDQVGGTTSAAKAAGTKEARDYLEFLGIIKNY